MATFKSKNYQFVEPLPDKFKCWECKQLLEEPHVTECCGQHFCKECIEKSSTKLQHQHNNNCQIRTQAWVSSLPTKAAGRSTAPPRVASSSTKGIYALGSTTKAPQSSAAYTATRSTATRSTTTVSVIPSNATYANTDACQECPSCNTKDFKHIRYLPLKRKINALIVYCPHKSKGCDEQVKLENIETHVSKCNYFSMWCSNNCGQALLRGQLQEHLTKSCPQRMITCQYCWSDHQYIETQNHLLKCPDFPLVCSNECGETRIKRKDMNSHKNVCPLEFVKCTFAEVGCTYYNQRKDLQVHVKENVEAHLSLMMEAHLKLKQELQRKSYIS